MFLLLVIYGNDDQAAKVTVLAVLPVLHFNEYFASTRHSLCPHDFSQYGSFSFSIKCFWAVELLKDMLKALVIQIPYLYF